MGVHTPQFSGAETLKLPVPESASKVALEGESEKALGGQASTASCEIEKLPETGGRLTDPRNRTIDRAGPGFGLIV